MTICLFCDDDARCAMFGEWQSDGSLCRPSGGSRGTQRCSSRVGAAGAARVRQCRARSALDVRGMTSAIALICGAAGLAAPQVALAQSAPNAGVSAVPLPLPSGADGGFASAISSDGSTVAGYVNTPSGSDFIIWTNRVPTAYPMPLGYSDNTYFSISGDGKSVAGTGYHYFDGFAWIWTQQGGQRIVPDISANEPIYGAGPISTDGRTLALNSLYGTRRVAPNGFYLGGTGPTGGGNAYLWTEAGGFQSIGHLTNDPKEIISITALSGDASTAAGQARRCSVCSGSGYPVYDINTAFVWRSGQGFTILPDLSANPAPTMLNPTGVVNSAVVGISRDGSTVVGASHGSDGRLQAVYWRSGQINPLGFVYPDDFTSTARFASANGNIIIGEAFNPARNYHWRWTAATGMQDIRSILTNAGLDLGNYQISSLEGMSDDGRIILGNWNDPTGSGEDFPLLIQLAQVTHTQLIVRVQLPDQTKQSIVNQSYSTAITGMLNGQMLATQTVGDSIDSSAGIQAMATVRSALSVGALRRILIGAPYLVSNTTSVAGSTSSTVNVLTDTSTTTAVIDTFGPATVITGDLGVCATAATNTALPTGCSLPGTAVKIDSGVLNTNIYTNTTESITPTTTVTVSQLITAKWQIDAVGGNQFGTAHALVGPAAFSRGNRLAALLLARGNAGGVRAAPGIGHASSETRDASGFGGDRSLTLFGGYYGDKTSLDSDPAVPVAAVTGSTDGFAIGLEKALGEKARIGLAIDYGKSRYRVVDPAFPESLDQSLTQIAAYGGWRSGGFSLAASAAYGFGNAKTIVATPTGDARAKRDVSAWSLAAEARYAVPLGEGEIGAAAGVRHTGAKLNAFTETGGSTPLVGMEKTVSRTRGYVGIDASVPISVAPNTRATPRLYARGAHDWGNAAGRADVVFASAPNGAPLTAYGPATGKWIAEVGGGLEVAVGDNFAIWGGYDAQLNSRTDTRTARAGLSLRF